MYKALVSFCGAVNMTKGDVTEIADKSIADNLLKAGFIEKVEPATNKKTAAKATNKKTTTKKK